MSECAGICIILEAQWCKLIDKSLDNVPPKYRQCAENLQDLLLYFAKGLIDIVQKRMGQYKINALLQKWFTTGLMTTGLNMSTLLQR